MKALDRTISRMEESSDPVMHLILQEKAIIKGRRIFDTAEKASKDFDSDAVERILYHFNELDKSLDRAENADDEAISLEEEQKAISELKSILCHANLYQMVDDKQDIL